MQAAVGSQHPLPLPSTLTCRPGEVCSALGNPATPRSSCRRRRRSVPPRGHPGPVQPEAGLGAPVCPGPPSQEVPAALWPAASPCARLCLRLPRCSLRPTPRRTLPRPPLSWVHTCVQRWPSDLCALGVRKGRSACLQGPAAPCSRQRPPCCPGQALDASRGGGPGGGRHRLLLVRPLPTLRTRSGRAAGGPQALQT